MGVRHFLLIFKHSVWKLQKSLIFNMNMSYLKEIGILKCFIARKSEKIGKIEKSIWKRHLANFNFSLVFGIFRVNIARFARIVVEWDFFEYFQTQWVTLLNERSAELSRSFVSFVLSGLPGSLNKSGWTWIRSKIHFKLQTTL